MQISVSRPGQRFVSLIQIKDFNQIWQIYHCLSSVSERSPSPRDIQRSVDCQGIYRMLSIVLHCYNWDNFQPCSNLSLKYLFIIVKKPGIHQLTDAILVHFRCLSESIHTSHKKWNKFKQFASQFWFTENSKLLHLIPWLYYHHTDMENPCI